MINRDVESGGLRVESNHRARPLSTLKSRRSPQASYRETPHENVRRGAADGHDVPAVRAPAERAVGPHVAPDPRVDRPEDGQDLSREDSGAAFVGHAGSPHAPRPGKAQPKAAACELDGPAVDLIDPEPRGEPARHLLGSGMPRRDEDVGPARQRSVLGARAARWAVGGPRTVRPVGEPSGKASRVQKLDRSRLRALVVPLVTPKQVEPRRVVPDVELGHRQARLLRADGTGSRGRAWRRTRRRARRRSPPRRTASPSRAVLPRGSTPRAAPRTWTRRPARGRRTPGSRRRGGRPP